MWGRDELKWNVIGHVKCQRMVPTGYKVLKWVLRGKYNAKWVGNLMGMISTCATTAGYDQNICSWRGLKIADFKQCVQKGYICPGILHIHHVHMLSWKYGTKWTSNCWAKGLKRSWLVANCPKGHKTSRKGSNYLKLGRGSLEHVGKELDRSKCINMNNP